jgi:hypothetical protein
LAITIRNLCTGLKLISPVYFSVGTTYYVSPSQQIDTGNTIETSFRMSLRQKDFKGALLYKIQRKHVTIIDNQFSSSTTSIDGTATNVYLLVFWNVFDIERHYHIFRVCLVECVDNFIWNEDELWTLRHQYNDRFCKNYNYRTITWLMDDGTVIRTGHDITYGSDCKLDIVISEGTWKYNMFRPMKIDPRRLVLPLLMSIVLIAFLVFLFNRHLN